MHICYIVTTPFFDKSSKYMESWWAHIYFHQTLVSSPSSPPNSPNDSLPFLPIHSSSIQTRAGIYGYLQKMAYQVSVKISTSPCIKAEQGNIAWVLSSQKSVKELDYSCLYCEASCNKTKTHNCQMYAVCLNPFPEDSLALNADSVSSYDPRLVDFVDFLVMSIPTMFMPSS